MLLWICRVSLASLFLRTRAQIAPVASEDGFYRDSRCFPEAWRQAGLCPILGC